MRWVVIFLSFVFLCSCTSRKVTPTRASRRAIDTIFQKQVLVIQPHMDSICNRLHDSIYAVAVESIMTERRIEMTNLVQ